MFKQIIIGLFAMSAVAILWTDANAGCFSIGGSLFCADWITGSGMPTGLVTATVSNTGLAANKQGCPAVESSQGGVDDIDLTLLSILSTPTPVTSLTLRLVGTVGTNCGLGTSNNDSCDIAGVALCGTSTNKKVTTPGPLTVDSPGFAQTDESSNSANFRFQLDTTEQAALCGTQTFVAFFAQEGFFEACVNGTTDCVRQFCKVDLGGIQSDRPRLYNCKPV